MSVLCGGRQMTSSRARLCARLFLAASLLTCAAADGPVFCGTCANGGPPPMSTTLLTATCASGTIASVWASYGTPDTATCGAYKAGACATPNSTAVVAAACAGKASCAVYPNTTTFGDVCFGTAKVLAVQLTCSAGAGAVACSTPSPPGPADYAAAVTAAWSSLPIAPPLAIAPSIQVVAQRNLFRGAAAHDGAFATLAQLGARHVRFVPWIPTAKASVAALDPPTVGRVCGPASWGGGGGQTAPVTLDCGAGATVADVAFASFGRPAGMCGAYTQSAACHAPASEAAVRAACVGKRACSLATAPGANPFGPAPCAGATWLAVELTCSDPARTVAYWNFSLPDALFTDVWDAIDGNSSDPIINFSTQPTWLYSTADWSYPEDPNTIFYGYDRGTAPATNATALGDYYGRLYAYFLRGRMTDEAGVEHVRPAGAAKIRTLEIYNEPDYEHGHTPQSYTADFDALVAGVRRLADPAGTIRYVGLNVPNIDDTDKVVSWAQYFLNTSNHAPGVFDDAASALIGYHLYPTNGGYSPDPTTFSRLFDYAEEAIAKVAAVDAVIAAQSPHTLTALDETGTDMDNVLGAGAPPGNAPRYWVAAAGYWAYLFGRLAASSPTVRVLGASQLMDAPGQEPSVTLVDWESGGGTARFWIVALFVRSFSDGDALLNTTVAPAAGGDAEGALDAQAFRAAGAPAGACGRLLLVNKRNARANVTLGDGACACAGARIIDELNGLQPARAQACAPLAGGGVGLELLPYAIAVVDMEAAAAAAER